jgi:SAM-dependent methyltransferase
MSATPEDPNGLDPLRTGLHGAWNMAAAGWGEHAGFIDGREAVVASRMLDLAAVRAGDRVLELACGPGGVGLAAAERVGPDGEVVLSDVAPGMIEIADARARDLRLGNVSVRVLDLERIDEPDDAYDVVLCREGLQLVPDPAQAAGEMRRVLRPGGRTVLAVWGRRADNPWLGVLLDAASTQFGAPMPPPGLPGPFSLDEPERLAAVLAGAGLVDVEVEELATPLSADSFEDWWSVVPSLAGPLAQVLAAQPEEARQAIQASARRALTAYTTPDGLEIPGLSLVAVARAPRSP